MSYTDIIQRTSALLELEIPITESDLENALKDLEMTRKTLLEERVEAQIELTRKRAQYLHPKDRDLTNLDREIMLNAHTTAEVQRFELLKGLEYLVKDRCATLSLLLDV
jgi:hypothetical protein